MKGLCYRGAFSLAAFFLLVTHSWGGLLTSQVFQATAKGTIKTPQNMQNVRGVKGPGANATQARAGGNAKGDGSTIDPVVGTGRRFDNTNATKIGPAGGKEKAIASGATVVEIARSLNLAYKGIRVSDVDFGRALEYDVVIDNDTVASAKNLGANQPLNTTLSSSR